MNKLAQHRLLFDTVIIVFMLIAYAFNLYTFEDYIVILGALLYVTLTELVLKVSDNE